MGLSLHAFGPDEKSKGPEERETLTFCNMGSYSRVHAIRKDLISATLANLKKRKRKNTEYDQQVKLAYIELKKWRPLPFKQPTMIDTFKLIQSGKTAMQLIESIPNPYVNYVHIGDLKDPPDCLNYLTLTGILIFILSSDTEPHWSYEECKIILIWLQIIKKEISSEFEDVYDRLCELFQQAVDVKGFILKNQAKLGCKNKNPNEIDLSISLLNKKKKEYLFFSLVKK